MKPSEEHIELADAAARQCGAIDDLLAGALEHSRPLAEVDGRSTTLALLSVSLIGVCTFDPAPTDVQILGFTIRMVTWEVLVGVLTLMVIYMASHVWMIWWSEYELWKLRGASRVKDAFNRVQELMKPVMDLSLDAQVAALSLNREILIPETFNYPHEKWSPAPVETVVEWMRKRLDQEKTMLLAAGYFAVYDQSAWQRKMDVCVAIETERARILTMHASDPSSAAESDIELEREKQRRLREIGPTSTLTIDRKMHPETVKVVNAYALAASVKLSRLVRMAHWRIWLMLIIPGVIAAVAILFGVVALARSLLAHA